mgnify:CR=1 FL=1
MIIRIADGREFDTATDLTGPERHILQKLIGWQSVAGSLAQFRQKTGEALAAGWNNSGPVMKSPLLTAIIQDMERQLAERLDKPALGD